MTVYFKLAIPRVIVFLNDRNESQTSTSIQINQLSQESLETIDFDKLFVPLETKLGIQSFEVSNVKELEVEPIENANLSTQKIQESTIK